jgi:VanZ family protein
MQQFIIWCKSISKYLLIGWLLTMIILSSIPNIPTLKIQTARHVVRLDYLMHFGEYGILSFLAFIYFAENKFRIGYRKVILVAGCIILFAILDELHQKLIPGRTYSTRDIMSDVTGVATAIVFTIFIFRSAANKLKKDE